MALEVEVRGVGRDAMALFNLCYHGCDYGAEVGNFLFKGAHFGSIVDGDGHGWGGG